jgi:ankyrin repeat protein
MIARDGPARRLQAGVGRLRDVSASDRVVPTRRLPVPVQACQPGYDGLDGSIPLFVIAAVAPADQGNALSTTLEVLKKGADPNVPNDAKATALMWAATDVAKTRVLLAHGAAVNAVSADFRTALIAAAARPGGAPVVKLLLDHGADPNLTTVTSPLIDAAIAGDAVSMELLLARGVATKTFGGASVALAARSVFGLLRHAPRASCSRCVATGKALVALHTAGLPRSDSAYQPGIQFLLNTQMQDGSWYVRTRAAGLQPYFDNGFPYGVDQSISAAATSWATMALTLAAPAPGSAASASTARSD